MHDIVRQDVLADDIRKEGRTIRRDLLGPMTRLRFGPDAPVPYFRRKLKQPVDTTQFASVLDVAVNRLGVSVPLGWAHEALGIPLAEKDGATVPGAGA